jgi:hypothetical protein
MEGLGKPDALTTFNQLTYRLKMKFTQFAYPFFLIWVIEVQGQTCHGGDLSAHGTCFGIENDPFVIRIIILAIPRSRRSGCPWHPSSQTSLSQEEVSKFRAGYDS